ncbi:MAG TPA: hypothetical protein DIT82_00465 [Bifidobacterium longum]|nr:hypothetical protein [Bifidobacterium longum]
MANCCALCLRPVRLNCSDSSATIRNSSASTNPPKDSLRITNHSMTAHICDSSPSNDIACVFRCLPGDWRTLIHTKAAGARHCCPAPAERIRIIPYLLLLRL